MFGYEYHWTDRLTLWEAAPLAEGPNWFEDVLAQIGIPEIILLLAVGAVVCVILENIGQKAIGKMAWVIALCGSAATLIDNIARIFDKGV
jgi:hypothetical protein